MQSLHSQPQNPIESPYPPPPTTSQKFYSNPQATTVDAYKLQRSCMTQFTILLSVRCKIYFCLIHKKCDVLSFIDSFD